MSVYQLTQLAKELRNEEKHYNRMRPVIETSVKQELTAGGSAMEELADEVLNDIGTADMSRLLAHFISDDHEGLFVAFKALAESSLNKVIDSRTEEAAAAEADDEAERFVAHYA